MIRFPTQLGALCLIAGVLPTQARGLQTSAILRLHNDFFDFWRAPGNRPDEEYTQGAELSVRWPGHGGLPLLGQKSLPRCGSETPRQQPCPEWSLTLGQDIYTPSIDSPHLLPGQRPYAGWLFLALSKQIESRTRMDGFRATIGVTGPPSLAETLQTGWHNLFGYRKPLGWAEQMPFEPAFAVSYLGARTVTASSAASGVALTPAAVWALTAGTLRTSGMLGLRAAFGAHAPPPWESTAHRELGAGTAVYLIAGVQGEVVARDMFLDGTLFRESPSVSRRWIVGQVEGGVGLTLGRVRLEWAVIHRAREYSTQPAPHTFARILMGWD